MHWNLNDMVVLRTGNGCNINTGDLLVTGTFSGTVYDNHGCLLEMTLEQKRLYIVSRRAENISGMVILYVTGWPDEGVGFGNCSGVVVPAHLQPLTSGSRGSK
jgi:fumarylacetoacetase